MRDLAFIATMLALLPLAALKPFVGALLWCWIAFMNPHRLVWGPAAEMPWAATVMAATLLGCVLAGEPRRLGINAVTLLLLALMACITTTTLAALGPPGPVWEKYESVMKVLLGLLVVGALLNDRARIHALVWVMVLSIGYYGVRGGIFSLATGGNYRVWGPPQTMITDNNHLAAALLVTLPLMNYLRLQSAHRLMRVGLAVAMSLTLIAVLASYSRGALLGLLAVMGLLWLRGRNKLVTGVAVVMLAAGAWTFMPSAWTERMAGISNYQEDGSSTERLVLWGISWQLALQRPLVGSGFTGPYSREVVDTVAPDGPARAVHSIWFELLGEHGFLTFFVWLGLTVAGLWYATALVRLGASEPALAWAGDLGRMARLSIAVYLVSGSFLSLSYWDFYWTLLVVLGAAHTVAAHTVAAPALVRGWAPAPARGWRAAA